METALLKQSHEDRFLEAGWLLALHFLEGWVCLRIQDRQWANLKPWSLGSVAALSNLSDYDEIEDAHDRHYLEPYRQELIYHTFWGVTPTPARIKVQFPPRKDLGSMLATSRTLSDNVGYIDGYKSPFRGPFAKDTEVITVLDSYPAVQAYNPLNDAMYNVMLNIDQMQYTYVIIKDRALIKDMLIGPVRVKKFTMGTAYPLPMNMPKWLQDLVSADLVAYSLEVMGGKA
jgi:hypothetical protein